MNTWTVPSADESAERAQSALTGIISCIGSPEFPGGVLGAINRSMSVGSFSVYRTSSRVAPVCYLSNSFKRRDTTRSCFSAYRDGIYRRDQTFDALDNESREKPLTIIHLTAQDVRNPDHRRNIYEQHGLRERLSVARRVEDGSILSVNLYRHLDQRGYEDRDFRVFGQLAAGLFVSVERQIELTRLAGAGRRHFHAAPRSGNSRLPNQDASTCAFTDELHHMGIEMPVREVEVCLRLLKGMSHDGIACDLGIGVTTVKTYRNRAFSRMNIHHNSELFALVLRHFGLSSTHRET